MDRPIVYPGQVPADTDLLTGWMAAMRAFSGVLAAAIGPGPAFDGLVVAPGGGLSVSVGPGSLLATVPADSTGYGSLGAASDLLVKQGINNGSTTLGPFTAPAAAGQSVNILIQAAFGEADANPVLLPYMNAANPALPLWGAGNDGAAQPTLRAQRVLLGFLAGAPAPSGTQATPAPSPGWTPLAVVSIANGQSSISAGNIATHPSAPLLRSKLGSVLQGGAPTADNSTALTSSAWVQSVLAAYATQAWVQARTPARMQVFGAQGTWTFTVPSDVTRARVTVIGGGGPGASAGAYPGGGGGAGGRAMRLVSGLTPGAAVTVTVGAAGDPGTLASGGTSSFGAWVSATGGAAGNPNSVNPAGGDGGAGYGGDVNDGGAHGTDGVVAANRGGDGGGPGGGRGSTGTSVVGIDAAGHGGGGGGAGGGAIGGWGGVGLVLVEF